MMPWLVGNMLFSAEGVVSASLCATASPGKAPTAIKLAAVKAEAAQRLNRDDIEIGLGLRIRFEAHAPKKRHSHGSRFRGDNGPFGVNPQGLSKDRPITLTLSRRLRRTGRATMAGSRPPRFSNDYIAW